MGGREAVESSETNVGSQGRKSRLVRAGRARGSGLVRGSGRKLELGYLDSSTGAMALQCWRFFGIPVPIPVYRKLTKH